MNGRKKPRQPRWPARVDVLKLAITGAGRLTPPEVDDLMAGPQRALGAMLQGHTTTDHWSELAKACTIGQAIEQQGVVRGLAHQLDTADAALQAIATRCDKPTGWTRTALYAHEIEALRELVRLHRFQVEQLSAAEHDRACTLANARWRQAMAHGQALEAA